MKRFNILITKPQIIFILASFLIWRIAILIIASVAVKTVPLFSNNYLGGGYSNYINMPIFWGHVNFDGEHFLSIAQNGYQPLEYFFFPVFPKLISILTMTKSLVNLAWSGIIVSNISFLIALVGIYELVRRDFSDLISKLTIVLFLVFPTSFYFGVYYSESIFLCLVVWSFLMARKNNFALAALLALLASATRVVGIIMFPALIVEFLIQNKGKIRFIDRKKFLSIFISPLGFIIYMYYLYKTTGDPLIFLHQASIFGEQRSSSLILLPQVLYRYFFKIVPHISYSFFPNVFTTYLELTLSLVFLGIILFSLQKLRLSYFFYAALAYIIPTFAGSFSSMPRYLIVVFPVFLYISILISKIKPFYRYVIFTILIIFSSISIALFWRGYWVS